MDQPWPIRLTHWLNVVFLTLLVGSGLRIFNAHPTLYLGETSDPAEAVWSGGGFPTFLTVGGWLAGARRWHLALIWWFVVNGLCYVAFLVASGEAKRRFFRPQDRHGVLPMVRYYLRLGPKPAYEGYNALQKLTYTLLVLLGAPLLVLTGLALSPAFDAHFPWYVALFGGRQSARTWHFALMAGFVLFSVLHVGLVAAAGWPTLRAMLVGTQRSEGGRDA
ncbi:MAG TPA: cytochrome b/b6 domain-containing protein [Stenomitos sp.]